jgi:WD40 repeat protein
MRDKSTCKNRNILFLIRWFVFPILLIFNSITASGYPVVILEGHSDWVNSVAVSPEGKYIVSGSFDTKIKIWNFTSGKLILTIGEEQILYGTGGA